MSMASCSSKDLAMKPVAVHTEWAYLNRIYNLFVWGYIFAALFTIAVMAYEIAFERGWL